MGASSTIRSPQRPGRVEPGFDDNSEPRARIRRLTVAVAASSRENTQLRRSLAQALAENRRLRAELAGRYGHADLRAHVHAMLSDRCSRNP